MAKSQSIRPRKHGSVARVCEHCGTEFFAARYSVKRGQGRYCSLVCYYTSAEFSARPNWRGCSRTHGDSGSPEHRSWTKMLSRCYNPNCTRYSAWGGRGIRVCDRWRHSYENFLADMGRKPSPKYQLDRRNNDGDYEPGNCYWATAAEQARNTRRTLLVTYQGRTQCVKDWALEVGIRPSLLQWRIHKGWPIERAMKPAGAA